MGGGQFGDKIVRKTIKATGVKSKYFASEKQTALDLGLAAVKKIIHEKKINPLEIGVIIFATQTPDYRVPATAMVVHSELRCSKDCIVFDVNLGCSGFVYGVYTVAALLQNISKNYGILIVGDISSKLVGKDDRAGQILFGDGVSAVLIGKNENSLIRASLLTDGRRYHAIMIPAGGLRHSDESGFKAYPVMDGIEVFNFSTVDVAEDLLEYEHAIKMETMDFDSIILHQANISILSQIRKKLKASEGQVAVSIDRYGNTSGASVPLTLCDYYGDKAESEVHVLMAGFGVGLSWGIIDTRIHTDSIYPIFYSDDVYDDGLVAADEQL